MNAGKLFKAAGLISAALVLSRLLGYVREALLAARFGATHISDAYLVAQEFTAFLYTGVAAALVMVFIPVYRDVVQKRGAEAANRLVATVVNALLLLSLILLVIGWTVVPLLMPRLVPGLPPEIVQLAVRLTRIMLPMLLFLGASATASAFLTGNREFTVPALVPVVTNVCLIGALLLVTEPGQVTWVAGAAVAGAAAGTFLQLPWVYRQGFQYEPALNLRDPALLQMGRLILPVLLTTGANQAQNIVDRFLASHLAEGSISALNYAVRLSALPYGVVGAAIATVLFPNLAEFAAARQIDELRKTVAGGLRTLAFVLIPMALGVAAFSTELVQVVFQRGAFNPEATAATAFALQFYAAGILFFGWLDFLNRSYFSLQDTLTPMWAAVGMVVLNVALNLALVGPLAQGGLALGTSLSTVAAVLVLVWHLSRRLGGLPAGEVLRSVLLTLATSAAGVLAGWVLYQVLPLPPVLRLGGALGTIVAVHLGLSFWLGVAEVTAVTRRFIGRKSRV